MTSTHSLLLYSAVIILISAVVVNSFQTLGKSHSFLTSRHSDNNHCSSKTTRLYSDTKGKNGKTKFGQKTDAEVSRFLTDFRTADGKVVDPYKYLQIKRGATQVEVKESYRRLSRKLHPDMVAQSNILPGRCANMDDVREQWEKVKFSYEILSDTKMRKNYDRNSSVAQVLEDPGAAVGRAVVGGAMTGLGMVFGSAWKLGEIATKKVYESAVGEKKETEPSVSEEEEEEEPQPQAWTQARMMEAHAQKVKTSEPVRETKEIESRNTNNVAPTGDSVNGNDTSNVKPISMPESPTSKATSVNQKESNDTSGYITKPMPETNGAQATGSVTGNDINSAKPIAMPESPIANATSANQEESSDPSSYKSKPTPETNGAQATGSVNGNDTDNAKPISMPENPTSKSTSTNQEESSDPSSYKSKPMPETNGAQAPGSVNGNDTDNAKPISMPESPTSKGTSANQEESNDISSSKSKPMPETNGDKATGSVNGNDTNSGVKPISTPESSTAKGTSAKQKKSNNTSSHKSKSTPKTNGAKATSPTKAATKKKTVTKGTSGSVRVSIKNNDIDLNSLSLVTSTSKTTSATGTKKKTGAKRKKTSKKKGGKGFSKQKK